MNPFFIFFFSLRACARERGRASAASTRTHTHSACAILGVRLRPRSRTPSMTGPTPMDADANGAVPPAAPPAVAIPIAGTADCVRLPLAALPADTGPVLDILRAEAAPLAVWRDVARAYLAQVKTRKERKAGAAPLPRAGPAATGTAAGLEGAELRCATARSS